MTNGYPNNNNKVKSIPLELYELAGKNDLMTLPTYYSARASFKVVQHMQREIQKHAF
jgi:hypothetical protein